MGKLLFALLVAILVAGCHRNLAPKLDPVREFAGARFSYLVGLEGNLGSSDATPFLSNLAEGYSIDKKREVLGLAGNLQGKVLFLLFEPGDVQVSLEGRVLSGKNAPVSISVNDEFLVEQRLGSEWQSVTFTVPQSLTRRGENHLGLLAPIEVEWRAASFQSTQPVPELRQGELLLPFAATLEYPLPPGGPVSLDLDIKPWLQPGAPVLEERDWELHLEVDSDDGKIGLSRKLNTFGFHHIELPPLEDFQRLTLSLQGDPKPGQLGIRVPANEDENNVPAPTAQTHSNPKRPNVVLFVVDTLRADYLQPYGCPIALTPNLEAFSRDAVLYQNAMAPSPWTKPSVATVITSLPPSEHGVVDFGDKLPEEISTLAEVLSKVGYENQAAWSNRLLDPVFGFGQGYQHFKLVAPGISGAQLVEEATQFREKALQDSPFFLHLHLMEPHDPYNPPATTREEVFKLLNLEATESELQEYALAPVDLRRVYKEQFWPGLPPESAAHRDRVASLLKALYSGEVLETDRAFGLLVQWLKDNQLYDDSLIIFVSDHGEELLDHGNVGHLHSLYQELVKVPLLVKLPGNRRAGTTLRSPCGLEDVMPIILAEVLGTEEKLDGRTDPVYFEVDAGRDATRFSLAETDYHSHSQGVRYGDLTYHRNRASVRPLTPLALYDLRTDPGEQTNIVWERPALALFLDSLIKKRAAGSRTRVELTEEETEKLRQDLRSLQYLR